MILVTYTLRELLALTDQDLAELEAIGVDPFDVWLWWLRRRAAWTEEQTP
jgi:hypothetical protein